MVSRVERTREHSSLSARSLRDSPWTEARADCSVSFTEGRFIHRGAEARGSWAALSLHSQGCGVLAELIPCEFSAGGGHRGVEMLPCFSTYKFKLLSSGPRGTGALSEVGLLTRFLVGLWRGLLS